MQVIRQAGPIDMLYIKEDDLFEVSENKDSSSPYICGIFSNGFRRLSRVTGTAQLFTMFKLRFACLLSVGKSRIQKFNWYWSVQEALIPGIYPIALFFAYK